MDARVGVSWAVHGRTVLCSLVLFCLASAPRAAGQSEYSVANDEFTDDAASVASDSNKGHFVVTVDSLTGSNRVGISGNMTLKVTNSVANIFDGRLTGGGIFEKAGSGDFTFSRISNTNTFNFAGTVLLDTGTLEFQGGSASSALTLGTLQLTGGTVLLDASYINVKTLNITGNTILDFGTGGGSVLNAENIVIAAGATLTVRNWSSEVDYLFATSTFQQANGGDASAVFNATGSAPENQIVFEGEGSGGASTAWINYNYGGYTNYEIRPIPEPSTYGAVFIGSCLAVVAWRRRRGTMSPPANSEA